MNLSTYRTIIVIIAVILSLIGCYFAVIYKDIIIGASLTFLGLGFSISCIISYLIKYYEE